MHGRSSRKSNNVPTLRAEPLQARLLDSSGGRSASGTSFSDEKPAQKLLARDPQRRHTERKGCATENAAAAASMANARKRRQSEFPCSSKQAADATEKPEKQKLPVLVAAPPAQTSAPQAEMSLCDKVSKIIGAFRAFDVNGDGVMDRNEFERLCWSLDVFFPGDDFQNMFNRIDKNKDGVIQYEEFINWLVGDDCALTQLRFASEAPKTIKVELNVRTVDDQSCLVKAAPDETAQCVRLRVCEALGIPLKKYMEIRLQVEDEDVKDGTPAYALANADLVAMFDVAGILLASKRKRIFWWKAYPLQLEKDIEAPAEVRVLVHVPAEHIICAICGTFILGWSDNTAKELWRQENFSASVLACGFSKKVFAGTDEGSVWAFNAQTGKHEWTGGQIGEAKPVRAIHVCPKSVKGLAVASADGGLMFLEASSGRLLWSHQLGKGDSDIRQLVGAAREGSSNRQAIFSASSNGLICAWNAQSERQTWNNAGNKDGDLQALCYLEKSDTVCVASASGRVLALEGRTGQEIFSQGIGQIRALSGFNQTVFVATDAELCVWDTSNNAMRWKTELHVAKRTNVGSENHSTNSATRSSVKVPEAPPPNEKEQSPKKRSVRFDKSQDTRDLCDAYYAPDDDSSGSDIEKNKSEAKATACLPVENGVLGLAYADLEAVISVASNTGLTLYDAKTGTARGTHRLVGGFNLLQYSYLFDR